MNAFTSFAGEPRGKPQRKSALDKVRADRTLLSKFYRKAKKEDEARTLAMPGGEQIKGLVDHLKKVEAPDEFIGLCQGQAAWINTLHPQIRFYFVAAVDTICERRRIEADLSPLDDPLPEDMDPEAGPSVFISIRKMVR